MDFLKFINIIIYCLLENVYLQNLDHLLSFCNDQHFRDSTFLVNEISNGSLIYIFIRSCWVVFVLHYMHFTRVSNH